MDIREAIKGLEENGNLLEVREVRYFEGYRDTASGSRQTIHVKIFDGGPGAGDIRYSCEATSENGKVTRGNEAESIDTALAITRWNELD